MIIAVEKKKNCVTSLIRSDFSAFLEYLRKEDNVSQRVGAISLGTVLGLLFGIRKGFFKKTLYVATGAGAAAAVCYPDEAKEYGGMLVSDVKSILKASYKLFHEGESDCWQKNVVLLRECSRGRLDHSTDSRPAGYRGGQRSSGNYQGIA